MNEMTDMYKCDTYGHVIHPYKRLRYLYDTHSIGRIMHNDKVIATLRRNTFKVQCRYLPVIAREYEVLKTSSIQHYKFVSGALCLANKSRDPVGAVRFEKIYNGENAIKYRQFVRIDEPKVINRWMKTTYNNALFVTRDQDFYNERSEYCHRLGLHYNLETMKGEESRMFITQSEKEYDEIVWNIKQFNQSGTKTLIYKSGFVQQDGANQRFILVESVPRRIVNRMKRESKMVEEPNVRKMSKFVVDGMIRRW